MANGSVYLNLLFVGLGGALGALSRYGITLALSPFLLSLSKSTNSVGTFVVNGLGCLLAGILFALKSKWDIPPYISVGVGFGFLGALTTFSTFSVDTLSLLQQNSYFLAILNVFLNLTVCLLMALLGLTITQKFLS